MNQVRPEHPISVSILLVLGFAIVAGILFLLASNRYKHNRRLGSIFYAVVAIACGLLSVGNLIDVFLKL